MRSHRSLAVRGGEIPLDRTRVFGILNVTPDSFSDGGAHFETARAVEHALRMQEEGADVLDVGAVSTRPGAADVDEDTERARILPVLEALAGRLTIPVSVDTFRARVLEESVERGAVILNDVTALSGDEAMAATVARLGVGVVLMHMQGSPGTMQAAPQYDDVVADVRAFLERAARDAIDAGIRSDAIVVDPGIGFGKTVEHNLELLRAAAIIGDCGHPVLFGTSRKSFLGKVLDRPDAREREYATAATTAHLFAEGVDFIRVHDVRAATDVLAVLTRLRERRPPA